LVESEGGDESPVADIRRMIRIFKELKEELKSNIQKQLNESQRTQI
jgi:hypothetical protein